MIKIEKELINTGNPELWMTILKNEDYPFTREYINKNMGFLIPDNIIYENDAFYKIFIHNDDYYISCVISLPGDRNAYFIIKIDMNSLKYITFKTISIITLLQLLLQDSIYVVINSNNKFQIIEIGLNKIEYDLIKIFSISHSNREKLTFNDITSECEYYNKEINFIYKMQNEEINKIMRNYSINKILN